MRVLDQIIAAGGRIEVSDADPILDDPEVLGLQQQGVLREGSTGGGWGATSSLSITNRYRSQYGLERSGVLASLSRLWTRLRRSH